MTTETKFLRIKTLAAPKAGVGATGAIRYAVLKDTDSNEVYFCLLANETAEGGAGGYFSREAVSFAKLQRCLDGLNAEGPIPAKVFKSAFVGRSSCNAGFILAALKNESLMKSANDASRQHVIAGDWTAWKIAMLAESGEPFELPDAQKNLPDPIAASAGEQATSTAKKAGKAKKSASVIPETECPEGGDNACAT